MRIYDPQPPPQDHPDPTSSQGVLWTIALWLCVVGLHWRRQMASLQRGGVDQGWVIRDTPVPKSCVNPKWSFFQEIHKCIRKNNLHMSPSGGGGMGGRSQRCRRAISPPIPPPVLTGWAASSFPAFLLADLHWAPPTSDRLFLAHLDAKSFGRGDACISMAAWGVGRE